MSIKSAERMMIEVAEIKAQVLLLEAAIICLHDAMRRAAVVPFSVGRDAMVQYEEARVEVFYRTDNLLEVEAILDPTDEALRYIEGAEGGLDASN